MRTLFVAFIMLGAATVCADDLGALKAAARRYVAAMKAVLALSGSSDCSETIANAGEYAAAKMAYYDAARQAMPALLQMGKGENSDGSYGKELTEIFRGFGEAKDEEATGILETMLSRRCPTSEQRDQTRMAVEQAQQIAEQFIKDFDGLDGI